MEKMDREHIQIISRHSNWSRNSVARALGDHVYNDSNAWKKFLSWFLLGVGISFTIAGILFFFAYNWSQLHKFLKFGLIEALIVVVLVIAMLAKTKAWVKKVLLTSASVLVGVLYAVFGQVYQTGANAYDFFLGWTIFVTLWVLVSNFAPLWLLFVVLINTTIVLYSEQVAHGWSEIFVFTLLFLLNALFLVLFYIVPKILNLKKIPDWFTNLVALAVISFSTIGITMGIFESKKSAFPILVLSSLFVYGLGLWFGLKARRVFYLAIIPFSIIIIICGLMLRLSVDAGMVFVMGLFIVSSVTSLVLLLIKLQKRWKN
ncbi:DUF2157 domain-containing protein [Flagellimonas nanhaiensis]|uniref:DUF2157 domain-containing protein n=1 Tax=Flagellimonas nanhaiensis TaxID=2292706 RepID=A0A371JQL0_9FLAO|nr:DUF2157 domain-containing protein [Allomuricauda nanhaiensis]RDY59792.1 DUF2157 domain-containing protein [Allomuricauda nanhaiensis]